MAILQNIVVPELASYIKQQFDSTGQPPTEAELMQHLNDIADRIVSKGQMLQDKILADHPELGK